MKLNKNCPPSNLEITLSVIFFVVCKPILCLKIMRETFKANAKGIELTEDDIKKIVKVIYD